jgi:hypothetical protein
MKGLRRRRHAMGPLRAVEYTKIEIELAWGKDFVSVAWVAERGYAG